MYSKTSFIIMMHLSAVRVFSLLLCMNDGGFGIEGVQSVAYSDLNTEQSITITDETRKRGGPRLMVVDVDAGVDDAWALLALLRVQRLGLVSILAVIAADGNTRINNVCTNVCRLLQIAEARDIPVYRGVERKDKQIDSQEFFGKDGFGDLEWDSQPDMSQVEQTSGLEALARLSKEHPGEISLVCLAPLTNIAEAMKLYPHIASNLKEIFIMGGNDPRLNERDAEFNFWVDPKSANAILTESMVPVTLLPVESCTNIELYFPWRSEVFKNTTNPAIQMFNRIDQKMETLKSDKSLPKDHIWWGCDLFLACGIINPAVFWTKMMTNAHVETEGPQKGLLIPEETGERKVTVVIMINSNVLKEEVLTSAEPFESNYTTSTGHLMVPYHMYSVHYHCIFLAFSLSIQKFLLLKGVSENPRYLMPLALTCPSLADRVGHLFSLL